MKSKKIKSLSKHYQENYHEKSSELFLRWCDENEIVTILDTSNWMRLSVGTRIHKYLGPDKFEYEDHSFIFKKRDGTRLFVFQPYATEEMLNKADLHGWCKTRGLKVKEISSEKSWHYPSATILVVIEIDDLDKYRQYVSKNIRA